MLCHPRQADKLLLATHSRGVSIRNLSGNFTAIIEPPTLDFNPISARSIELDQPSVEVTNLTEDFKRTVMMYLLSVRATSWDSPDAQLQIFGSLFILQFLIFRVIFQKGCCGSVYSFSDLLEAFLFFQRKIAFVNICSTLYIDRFVEKLDHEANNTYCSAYLASM